MLYSKVDVQAFATASKHNSGALLRPYWWRSQELWMGARCQRRRGVGYKMGDAFPYSPRGYATHCKPNYFGEPITFAFATVL